MALSGTNRGTGGNATASTTINISPNANLTSGADGIIFIAYDNAGGGGADVFSAFSWTNFTGTASGGSLLNDPGAASAGTVLRWWRATGGSITTSSVFTVTFTASVTAKAWTFTEIVSDISGATIEQVSFNNAQGNGTTQTISPSPNPLSGMLVIGVLGQEGNGTRTADSDTTNGSWSTAQSTGFGTTTAGQEIISQFKVVNADGAQTYNPTASPLGDWNMAIWAYREIAPAEAFDPFGMMGFFGI